MSEKDNKELENEEVGKPDVPTEEEQKKAPMVSIPNGVLLLGGFLTFLGCTYQIGFWSHFGINAMSFLTGNDILLSFANILVETPIAGVVIFSLSLLIGKQYEKRMKAGMPKLHNRKPIGVWISVPIMITVVLLWIVFPFGPLSGFWIMIININAIGFALLYLEDVAGMNISFDFYDRREKANLLIFISTAVFLIMPTIAYYKAYKLKMNRDVYVVKNVGDPSVFPMEIDGPWKYLGRMGDSMFFLSWDNKKTHIVLREEAKYLNIQYCEDPDEEGDLDIPIPTPQIAPTPATFPDSTHIQPDSIPIDTTSEKQNGPPIGEPLP
ncbi:MAG: hypothetical protein AAFR61_00055 [Bacteroidota bacterium]